ncbi:MAG: lipopolysaccharide biosynthesis protein [Mesorhizobium sp.]|uniref:lipopolysaccharide biosynthesis protein n=1 Tax=Mesorhizobium sp. TaxID=1871066 RepID=UPI000FE56AA0|nr:oligosaccharide flippase family protein [Mesorhizobium sp.]RWP42700.1 MAG: lipopolysaccharide biosynthesis protein [Mesorhizobium sp.]
MKLGIPKLIARPFVRNVATVASGAAAAQVIATIASPFITRLYGPEAFGALGVFNSIVSVATSVTCLTYPVAIVLPKQDSVALELVRLSVVLALVSSVVAMLFILFLGPALAEVLQAQLILPYLWFVPVAMFAGGVLQVTQQWMLRRQAFQTTAYVSVVQAGAINLLKIVLGYFHPIAATLIIVAAFDALLQSFLLVAARVRMSSLWTCLSSNTWGGELRAARFYSDFPVFRAPQGLVNAVALGFPVFAISAAFGPVITGHYVLAVSVLALPTRLIGKSVADVFYPRIVRSFQNGENGAEHLVKATGALSMVGLLPFFAVFFIGPWIFAIVFGQEWRISGEFARWLAIAQFFFFIARPAVVTVSAVGAQKMLLKFELVSLIARVGLFLVVVLAWDDPLPAVIALSLANVFLYSFLIYGTYVRAKSWTENADKKAG